MSYTSKEVNSGLISAFDEGVRYGYYLAQQLLVLAEEVGETHGKGIRPNEAAALTERAQVLMIEAETYLPDTGMVRALSTTIDALQHFL